jgi:hypothetical protein
MFDRPRRRRRGVQSALSDCASASRLAVPNTARRPIDALAVFEAGTGVRCVWGQSAVGQQVRRSGGFGFGRRGRARNSPPDSNQPIERHRLAFFPPTPGAIVCGVPCVAVQPQPLPRAQKGSASACSGNGQKRRLMLNSPLSTGHSASPATPLRCARGARRPRDGSRCCGCCGFPCDAVVVRVDVLAGAGGGHGVSGVGVVWVVEWGGEVGDGDGGGGGGGVADDVGRQVSGRGCGTSRFVG